MGSSISYPNSPTAEYVESDIQAQDPSFNPSPHANLPHSHSHHHHLQRHAHQGSVLGPAATLGRHSGRFGGKFEGKSPFRVVVPASSTSPPVCSTPQNSLPILDALMGDQRGERVLPEFSTFGAQSGFIPKQQRSEPIEPNGHLV